MKRHEDGSRCSDRSAPGRSSTFGEVELKTMCYADVVRGADADRRTLQDVLLRDAELVDRPHEAETFWLPADSIPTTSLERIAKSIYDFHVKNAPQQQANSLHRSPDANALPTISPAGDSNLIEKSRPHGRKRARTRWTGADNQVDRRTFSLEEKVERNAESSAKAGAEWWIQIREEGKHSNLGMPFHWDKDEQLLEEEGLLVCPDVSTVTYLTDHGAPTIVLESRATDKGAVVEGDIDQAFVSFPSLFKHVAFDGRFLHGVPEQMRRIVKREGHDRGRMRVTLLVNVWLAHKPAGIRPLSSSIANTLSANLRDFGNPSFDQAIDFTPVPVAKRCTHSEDTIAGRETGGAKAMMIEAPLGPTSLLQLRAPTPDSLSTGGLERQCSFVLLYGEDCRSRIAVCQKRANVQDLSELETLACSVESK